MILVLIFITVSLLFLFQILKWISEVSDADDYKLTEYNEKSNDIKTKN
jgi:hypothetical protein